MPVLIDFLIIRPRIMAGPIVRVGLVVVSAAAMARSGPAVGEGPRVAGASLLAIQIDRGRGRVRDGTGKEGFLFREFARDVRDTEHALLLVGLRSVCRERRRAHQSRSIALSRGRNGSLVTRFRGVGTTGGE